MDLLKRLFGSSVPSAQRRGSFYALAVQCSRCGELISTQINLNNDLSVGYGEGEDKATYFCRKVLVGRERCFQPVEVRLRFDADRQLIDRQITGGRFVE